MGHGKRDVQMQEGSSPLAIRARAPLRLGLAGGGTDLSPYCDEYGGAVLNVTIDRFANAFVKTGDGALRFQALDLGIAESFQDRDALAGARLHLHRAVHERLLREAAIGNWIDLTVATSVESPPGSGLGSSSALVVALVEAYRAYFQLPLGPYDVARLAYEIERVDLKLQGGRQDQYAAAFGGVNFIEFLPNDRVVVNPLRVESHILNELENSLVICFSGVSRSSMDIINAQKKGLSEVNSETLHGMHILKKDAQKMKGAFLAGDFCEMATILNRSWDAKKRTASGIQTSLIGELQAAGIQAGARATKVSGAGGGGFIMFLVAPELRQNLIDVLNRKGGSASPVKFVEKGVESWTRLTTSL